MSHARVPRQPGVQVAHARLVHAEDQEGRQAVGATLAAICVGLSAALQLVPRYGETGIWGEL